MEIFLFSGFETIGNAAGFYFIITIVFLLWHYITKNEEEKKKDLQNLKYSFIVFFICMIGPFTMIYFRF